MARLEDVARMSGVAIAAPAAVPPHIAVGLAPVTPTAAEPADAPRSPLPQPRGPGRATDGGVVARPLGYVIEDMDGGIERTRDAASLTPPAARCVGLVVQMPFGIRETTERPTPAGGPA